jgi:hypothetical protein
MAVPELPNRLSWFLAEAKPERAVETDDFSTTNPVAPAASPNRGPKLKKTLSVGEN